jgi:hypothetical protein
MKAVGPNPLTSNQESKKGIDDKNSVLSQSYRGRGNGYTLVRSCAIAGGAASREPGKRAPTCESGKTESGSAER